MAKQWRASVGSVGGRRDLLVSNTWIVLLVTLAGCSATALESTDEYIELNDERNELAAEIEDLRDRLDEATADREAGDEVVGDFALYLALDVRNRVGLDPAQSACVADALTTTAEVRRAYLSLIDPDENDPDALESAYAEVTVVMEECGVAIAGADQSTDSTADAFAAMVELLGEVEVIGDVLPEFTDTGDDPAIGLTAPVVVGADYDGDPVTIDAAADGPTMVIVVAHWCPHCNAEIPKINELRDTGRIPDEVNIVAISSSITPDRANFPPDEWIAAIDWTFPVIADGPAPDGSFAGSGAYGTAGVPFVALLDENGVVVDRWAGERGIDDLAAALAGLAG